MEHRQRERKERKQGVTGGMSMTRKGLYREAECVEVTPCHMINDIIYLMLLVLPFRIMYGCLHNQYFLLWKYLFGDT